MARTVLSDRANRAPPPLSLQAAFLSGRRISSARPRRGRYGVSGPGATVLSLEPLVGRGSLESKPVAVLSVFLCVLYVDLFLVPKKKKKKVPAPGTLKPTLRILNGDATKNPNQEGAGLCPLRLPSAAG